MEEKQKVFDGQGKPLPGQSDEDWRVDDQLEPPRRPELVVGPGGVMMTLDGIREWDHK